MKCIFYHNSLILRCPNIQDFLNLRIVFEHFEFLLLRTVGFWWELYFKHNYLLRNTF